MKGRKMRVPRGDIRPTQDRVREALFSSLASRLAGASFLDLFAGCGAVGIEAWSRGCASVCMVERDRAVCRVLEENVRELCDADEEQVCMECMDVGRFLRYAESKRGFDIVYADPPYEDTLAWFTKALQAPGLAAILDQAGVLIVEACSGVTPVEAGAGWMFLKERTYGGTALWMYQRQS